LDDKDISLIAKELTLSIINKDLLTIHKVEGNEKTIDAICQCYEKIYQTVKEARLK
jgi:hypothetical protein